MLFYVPLSVLAKWPPLLDFDLDINGQPAHLLTAVANGAMDQALLNSLLDNLVGSDRAACCTGAVHDLATSRSPTPAAIAAYEAIRTSISDAQPEEVKRNVLRIASAMQTAYILWVPAFGTVGDRYVAHFAYDYEFKRTARLRTRAVRTLAWGGEDEYLVMGHVGLSGSYHIDVEAPPDLAVTDSDLYFIFDRPGDGNGVPQPPPVYTQQVGSRAHVYTSGERTDDALLRVRLTPTRRGFLAGAWIAALGIAALLTAFWRWSDELSNDPTSSVAVLVIVPGILGLIALRPRTHPWTFDRLIGVQLLLFLSGALSVTAALVAIRYGYSAEPARALWRDAAYGAYLVLLMVSVSLWRAAPG
jgi:hypothetical protein